ncbi:MAG: acetyl-CoA acetyltransferase [Deltaproteobacteria bacterium RIFCSPLOWO2_12_FULL_44_12]|nr:MAG: acetyl-CoA acetyltransferase [Deltaproteobacteria bacterium RIFCSPHIGHO2_01_FULL_43_49]OGQ15481.1 MAG: acetyl-CoA acetyltransferase [Deltaproteobacteria bacterium RIFCSPHIGHO2_02_FULL_44_53]OGQ29674.1 MAG: acetyl-CoA acetyltransferase [Deltaproteobacteria bacterium RIFCSPHIGHO2_12_FULL_44_21]OGQ32287.1 MAG: acetyl-CoA acetyltransferase [Deltaproteobacteria bacterium RIFCSPLOWO2_01_FULL_45_74]OGQ43929.1 MAG: acetyl-CoA acetyltransferase [Deltaproteobacteria bacterium RIFCSPLOWO2_02_FULL_
MKSVIVSACRTPVGSFLGGLSNQKATELGAIVVREAVKKAGLKPELIDEVIMGCVLAAGLGQSPARQAALGAGLPNKVGVLTVNKVCASGLKAVMLADEMIRCGDAEIVVAGGMESMSNAPYLLPKARQGLRMGNLEIIDSMIHDGLLDAYSNKHMGNCAEMCAKKYSFSRQSQDQYAIESYKRALAAIENKKFLDEIVAVGEFEKDEEPFKVKFDKIPTLKPVFEKDGTVTVANASSINDGAAACVVMPEEKAKSLGLKPLGRIVGYAGASREPEWFTIAPIDAINKLLGKLNLKTNDIDLWEINEAFAVVMLAALQELKLDYKKVNSKGGAVALGHPIGASGARLLTTLIYSMKEQKAKRGLVSLCNGGGEAVAMVVESL